MSELLKPRYKVIADYPASEFFVGSIRSEECFDLGDNEYKYSAFPHLFKPLAWYEDREASEMPEYVKYKKDILKVTKWFNVHDDIRFHSNKKWITDSASACEPATETEYNQYLKTKQK